MSLLSSALQLFRGKASYQKISSSPEAELNPDAMMHGENIGPRYAKSVNWASIPPSTSQTGPLPENEQSPTTAPIRAIPAVPGTLHLAIYPAACASPNPAEHSPPTWVAFIWLRTEDLARLMRDGFYWDASNVIKEAGFLTREKRNKLPWWGPTIDFPGNPAEFHCRHFSLRSSGDGPNWTASLTVWTAGATGIKVIRRFRLSDLCPENIMYGRANDNNGRAVYGFDRCRDDCFFNCIYDDMPLRGWWPWPKAMPEEEEGAKKTLGEVKCEEEGVEETFGKVNSEAKSDEEGAKDMAGKEGDNPNRPWQLITTDDL